MSHCTQIVEATSEASAEPFSKELEEFPRDHRRVPMRPRATQSATKLDEICAKLTSGGFGLLVISHPILSKA